MRPPDDRQRPDFDDFVRSHEHRFRRAIARNPGLRDQDCDDVYSDTLYGLWTRWAKLDPTKSAVGLACVIAVGKSRTRVERLVVIRRRESGGLVADDRPDYRPAGRTPDADERRTAVRT